MDGVIFLALLAPPVAGAAAGLVDRGHQTGAFWFNAVTLPVAFVAAAWAADALSSGRQPF